MENNPHLQRTMTKTQMLLWKTTKTAKKIPDNMSEHFLFYSELTPTDPWCNMLQTLLGRKNIWGGTTVLNMSDEQPLKISHWCMLTSFSYRNNELFSFHSRTYNFTRKNFSLVYAPRLYVLKDVWLSCLQKYILTLKRLVPTKRSQKPASESYRFVFYVWPFREH